MAASIVIIAILAIASVIAAFVLILPEKRKARLSPFWYRVREFLTMRVLYLEKILRTLYVIATVFTFVLCVAGGLLSPFLLPNSDKNFGSILLGMILGLLAGIILAAVLLFIIRISYESTMLKVSLTKAAKDINEKIGGSSESRSYEEPRRRPAPAPRPVTCRYCGTRFDPRRGYCPNCDERW